MTDKPIEEWPPEVAAILKDYHPGDKVLKLLKERFEDPGRMATALLVFKKLQEARFSRTKGDEPTN